MYYIISLKYTCTEDFRMLLWRPNSAGYTYHKSKAGIFANPNCDSETDLAVPVEGAEKLFSAKWRDKQGKLQPYIPNDTATKKKLGVRQTKNGLVRI